MGRYCLRLREGEGSSIVALKARLTMGPIPGYRGERERKAVVVAAG